MLTLDGRMRFNVPLGEAEQTQFRDDKLREIVLVTEAGLFVLYFSFGVLTGEADDGTQASPGATPVAPSAAATSASTELPEYLLVIDEAPPTPGQGLPPGWSAAAAPGADHNRSDEIHAR